MIISKILKVVLLLLGGVFVALQTQGYGLEGAALMTVLLFLCTVLYIKNTDKKSNLFLGFLITYTLAQFFTFLIFYFYDEPLGQFDYYYLIANFLYISAYTILIIRILAKINLKKVISSFIIPVIILIVLDVFCVYMVSSTANYPFNSHEFVIETLYNVVLMTLLSIAMLNYMYRNDKKSILFLLASIFVVFSEIIQIAYYYILDVNQLGFTYSLFLVAALFFFYIQSQLKFSGPVSVYTDDVTEV
ncbi:hypothetical protein [Winogradskyella bathintestinalis]|uniref:YhhN-like protein n=1 Tax=Winogradskyella bathintestinalis TaxID=3035208 RepID=A0ABT7ZZ63_9FLAO|nr:hypothetical protein [Winogradskyella bathintestinalis]MDN3494018.1 hypothetical protein [Winogradskyella bathintestinalis]